MALGSQRRERAGLEQKGAKGAKGAKEAKEADLNVA